MLLNELSKPGGTNSSNSTNLSGKRSSSTSIECSFGGGSGGNGNGSGTSSDTDYEELNFVHYYPACIQKINGTLITVIFEASSSTGTSNSGNAGDSGVFSRSYSVPLSASLLVDSLNNTNQQTYDVARDGQKYALIEDAAPMPDHLEKGVYVLYRYQNSAQTVSSHPSTPTPSTPTSPVNNAMTASTTTTNTSSSSSTSSNAAANSEFKYRLGKIVDTKEKKKYYLIQPVNLDTKNNYLNSFGASSGQSLESIKEMSKLQLVTRPNLRLLAPPWYSENKQELDLKHSKEINLQTLFPPYKMTNSGAGLGNAKKLIHIQKCQCVRGVNCFSY